MNTLRLERDSEVDKICQLEWRVGRFGGWVDIGTQPQSICLCRLPNADRERHRCQILQALLTLMASLLWISHAGKVTAAILKYLNIIVWLVIKVSKKDLPSTCYPKKFNFYYNYTTIPCPKNFSLSVPIS